MLASAGFTWPRVNRPGLLQCHFSISDVQHSNSKGRNANTWMAATIKTTLLVDKRARSSQQLPSLTAAALGCS